MKREAYGETRRVSLADVVANGAAPAAWKLEFLVGAETRRVWRVWLRAAPAAWRTKLLLRTLARRVWSVGK